MSAQIAGLNELVADLRRAESSIQRNAAAVVERGALNVKNDARQFAQGIAHAPLYPESIDYSIHPAGLSGVIWAEIGPDKSKPQGPLGNLLEYGSVNNAPLAHLGPALDIEGPKFIAAIGAAAEAALQ